MATLRDAGRRTRLLYPQHGALQRWVTRVHRIYTRVVVCWRNDRAREATPALSFLRLAATNGNYVFRLLLKYLDALPHCGWSPRG